MGEVIEFPGLGEPGIRKALNHFKSVYKKAGLAEHQIESAVVELEPIVRSFLVRKEFEFNLNGNFSEGQIALIAEAHNQTMQSAIKYFSHNIWMALCNIAGLIGREAKNA